MKKSKEVVLEYNGQRVIRKVPNSWQHISLPVKFLNSYFDESENINSDDDITFRPSNIVDGDDRTVWVAQ